MVRHYTPSSTSCSSNDSSSSCSDSDCQKPQMEKRKSNLFKNLSQGYARHLPDCLSQEDFATLAQHLKLGQDFILQCLHYASNCYIRKTNRVERQRPLMSHLFGFLSCNQACRRRFFVDFFLRDVFVKLLEKSDASDAERSLVRDAKSLEMDIQAERDICEKAQRGRIEFLFQEISTFFSQIGCLETDEMIYQFALSVDNDPLVLFQKLLKIVENQSTDLSPTLQELTQVFQISWRYLKALAYLNGKAQLPEIQSATTTTTIVEAPAETLYRMSEEHKLSEGGLYAPLVLPTRDHYPETGLIQKEIPTTTFHNLPHHYTEPNQERTQMTMPAQEYHLQNIKPANQIQAR
mmetsp:Transcript_2729/g.2886  ORF Transcript_2729/g.2886 Transcript_2729/m.2886 type:complete len:349 (+) Transcript_2729:867-1913(+)